MQTHILTVTQLSHQIKNLLEGTFPEVWSRGDLEPHRSPVRSRLFHDKDEQSQIKAVLFKSSQASQFTLQHGCR